MSLMPNLRVLGKAASALCWPSHLRLVLRDACGWKAPVHEDQEHLKETIAWLCRAQDASDCGGVSAGYHAIDGGWLPPYPETTGYIIPTLIAYGEWAGDEEQFVERAVRMGNWEIEIQLDSGAVRGGIGINQYPDVFNTGQVIQGWLALWGKTKDARFLAAAQRAGRWLVELQDSDGKWSAHSYLDLPHSYHSRVAWPLLQLHAATGDPALLRCARQNVHWTLSQSSPDGWTQRMGFRTDEYPLTHTIGYTLEGLLGCAPYLDDPIRTDALVLVRVAAERILLSYERRKPARDGNPRLLAARMDSQWRPHATYSCLTGNAQIALVWLKLYQRDGDPRYLYGARKLLDHVKSAHSLTSANPGIRGGVAGSSPCWGRYFPLAFPNWAAKFFADALMLREQIVRPLKDS
jgi:hypothetical protein